MSRRRSFFRPTLECLESRIVPYALTGYAWPNTNVSASFMPDGTITDGGIASNLFAALNAIAPTANWQREFARALQTWANVTPLNFHLVSDNGAAVGISGSLQGDSRFGDIRLGGYVPSATWAGYGYYPAGGTIGGDEFLNTSVAWHIGANPDIYSFFLHETGHAIGLDHSTVTAVMDPTISSVYTGLYGDDMAGAQAIYGARHADTYDTAAANGTQATATTIALNSSAALAIQADITTMSDVDYYRVVAPAAANGSFTVTVDARNLSLFDGSVSVYDGAGNLLGTAAAPGYGSFATVNLTGMTAGQTYYLKVNGGTTDAFGMGAYKLNAQFGTATLGAPSSLTASAPSNSQVNLTWVGNDANATSYIINRSSDGVTWTQVATIAASTSSYSDMSATSGRTWSYRVSAASSSAQSTPSNTASVTLAPIAPSGLLATAASSSQINLTWSDVTGETGFKVERSSDGVTWTQIATTATGVLSYQNIGLAASTTYQYRVRAYNTGGNSGYSNQVSATTSAANIVTVPLAPSNLTATTVSTTQINLAWVDNSNNETGFVIQRFLNGRWSTIAQVGANVTTYADTTVTSRKTYQYRVYAINSAGNSAYSNLSAPAAGAELGDGTVYWHPPISLHLSRKRW